MSGMSGIVVIVCAHSPTLRLTKKYTTASTSIDKYMYV